MVLYTLYFIFYSVYIHFSLSLFLRLLRPFHLLRYTTPLCSSLAFSPRCMTTTTTTRLHAERARRLFLRQILCRWRTRSGSDLASFDSDTLALHSTLFLHFSLPLTHSFSLSHLLLFPVRPHVVGETFFRSITFIGRRSYVRQRRDTIR